MPRARHAKSLVRSCVRRAGRSSPARPRLFWSDTKAQTFPSAFRTWVPDGLLPTNRFDHRVSTARAEGLTIKVPRQVRSRTYDTCNGNRVQHQYNNASFVFAGTVHLLDLRNDKVVPALELPRIPCSSRGYAQFLEKLHIHLRAKRKTRDQEPSPSSSLPAQESATVSPFDVIQFVQDGKRDTYPKRA